MSGTSLRDWMASMPTPGTLPTGGAEWSKILADMQAVIDRSNHSLSDIEPDLCQFLEVSGAAAHFRECPNDRRRCSSQRASHCTRRGSTIH